LDERSGDTRPPIEGAKYLRTIVATAPFIDIRGRRAVAGTGNNGRRGARRIHESDDAEQLHPVGTCRWAGRKDPTTVVTPDLRVKGIDGLRVMDASIMPRIISANTNATVMAVADKGVDLLTGTYTGRVAAAQ